MNPINSWFIQPTQPRSLPVQRFDTTPGPFAGRNAFRAEQRGHTDRAELRKVRPTNPARRALTLIAPRHERNRTTAAIAGAGPKRVNRDDEHRLEPAARKTIRDGVSTLRVADVQVATRNRRIRV